MDRRHWWGKMTSWWEYFTSSMRPWSEIKADLQTDLKGFILAAIAYANGVASLLVLFVLCGFGTPGLGDPWPVRVWCVTVVIYIIYEIYWAFLSPDSSRPLTFRWRPRVAVIGASLISVCFLLALIRQNDQFWVWVWVVSPVVLLSWLLASASVGIRQAILSGQPWSRTQGGHVAVVGAITWLVAAMAVAAIFFNRSQGDLAWLANKLQQPPEGLPIWAAYGWFFLVPSAAIGALAALADYLWRRRLPFGGIFSGTLTVADALAQGISRVGLVVQGAWYLILAGFLAAAGYVWWAIAVPLSDGYPLSHLACQGFGGLVFLGAVLTFGSALQSLVGGLRVSQSKLNRDALGTASHATGAEIRAKLSGAPERPPWAGHGHRE